MNIKDLKKKLADKYEFRELIGRGGFAEVYLARDKRLEREVAIKVLLPQYASEAEMMERFIREAKLYAKLEHRNLIPVFDTGIISPHAFIVMKFIRGESAKSLQQKMGKLPMNLIIRIIRQMADTLQYIHDSGIIHRDIKPSNIIIEEESGNIYLADFGIARSDSSKTLTQSGLILGTPHYISPEQINGKHIDHRSDLYALGIMLYELASGKSVFSGETPMDILYQHVNVNPVPITRSAPEIPREIKYIISRCIEKKAENRFQSAAEIIRVLQNPKVTMISKYLKTLEKDKTSGVGKKFAIMALLLLTIGISFFLIKNLIISRSGNAEISPKTTPVIDNSLQTPIQTRKQSSEAQSDEDTQVKDSTRISVPDKNKGANQPPDQIQTSGPEAENKTSKAPVASRLKFSSFPAADVYWNNVKLGNTTQIFFQEFNPGKYRFKFEIPGYRSIEKEVLVKNGIDINVHQKFKPYGMLTITSKPFARIYINGKDYGSDFIFKKKMPVGEYSIRAIKDGYQIQERIINLETKKTVNIHFNLEKEERNDL